MMQFQKVVDGRVIAAIDRLIEIATSDRAQGGPVMNFLLSWWHSGVGGGFRLTELCSAGVDEAVAEDMATVFGLVARSRCTPESLGYRTEFERLVDERRHQV